MTVAEVMIAALVLTLGSLAVLSLVGASARNSYRGEQSQVVSNRLQQEVEQIEQLPYDQIALTGLPADSTNTNNPSWRVAGTSYAVAQDGTGLRPLVYNGSALVGGGTVTEGAVNPTPTTFTSGDVSGTIYRFVVWENDPTCPETACPGLQDLKRVIVSIVLDGTPVGGAIRRYQELQSQTADPEVTPPDDENPLPPGEDPRVPWTFYLTDTTCDNADRLPITENHLVHNTNGVCSAGLKNSTNCAPVTGCQPGAPDWMFTKPPVLSGEQPLWDFATDIEPDPPFDATDRGLQMPPPSSNGCLSSLFQPLTNALGALINDPDATRMQTIHKWISKDMGSGFNVTLSGEGAVNLWTQSVNGASYAGRICIWLFERHLNVFGIPVDTPAVNLDPSAGGVTYFTHSENPWPTGWTELHITLNFDLGVTLSSNSRLGLAIQVENSGTDGGGLQFLYDEPTYDTRLEVKTESVLPF